MLCIILNYLIKNTFGPSPIVFIIKCLVSCKPSLPYYMRLSYFKKKKYYLISHIVEDYNVVVIIYFDSITV